MCSRDAKILIADWLPKKLFNCFLDLTINNIIHFNDFKENIFVLNRFWLGILLFWITFTAQASQVPQVVVSIKPIHSLVMNVMEGIAEPYLLLSGGESPHTYSLRPSQVRQLHQANLLIWIGPSIETFLDKTVATLSNQTQQLRLFELPNLSLLKIRKGGAWETSHSHDEKKETTPTHKEPEEVHSEAFKQAYQWDQHIWLDPHNAKVMVSAIVQALTQVDPDHASQYTKNANSLIQRLDELDQHLRKSLLASQNLPFLVFHDAYHYFENRYHLTAVGSITLSPETLPSAKRLQALRTRINQLQVRCIFSEPQFESSLVKTLIEGTSVRPGTLDPLGIELAAGTAAYFELLRQLAQLLNECLLSQ